LVRDDNISIDFSLATLPTATLKILPKQITNKPGQMLEIVLFSIQESNPTLTEFLTTKGIKFTQQKYLAIKTLLSNLKDLKQSLKPLIFTQERVTSLDKVLYENSQLKKQVKLELEILMQSNQTEIYLIQNELEIYGVRVEETRMESLVVLDRLFGLKSFGIEIPIDLHSIVNGRKRVCLNEIMNASRTSFYFPIGFKNGNGYNENGNDFGDDENGYGTDAAKDGKELNLVVVTGLEKDIEFAVEKYMQLVHEVVSFQSKIIM
jgi:hypothetical protein